MDQWTLQDLRRWCGEAGITGTDLDTAIKSWAVNPTGADGGRVQAVVERNRPGSKPGVVPRG